MYLFYGPARRCVNKIVEITNKIVNIYFVPIQIRSHDGCDSAMHTHTHTHGHLHTNIHIRCMYACKHMQSNSDGMQQMRGATKINSVDEFSCRYRCEQHVDMTSIQT